MEVEKNEVAIVEKLMLQVFELLLFLPLGLNSFKLQLILKFLSKACFGN